MQKKITKNVQHNNNVQIKMQNNKKNKSVETF